MIGRHVLKKLAGKRWGQRKLSCVKKGGTLGSLVPWRMLLSNTDRIPHVAGNVSGTSGYSCREGGSWLGLSVLLTTVGGGEELFGEELRTSVVFGGRVDWRAPVDLYCVLILCVPRLRLLADDL